MDKPLQGEKRPIDALNEISGISREVAELVEHIRDTQPEYRRDRLLNEIIEAVDDINELSLRTSVSLEGLIDDE